MSRLAQHLLYVCCVSGAVIASSDGNELIQCNSSEQCRDLSAGNLAFCCGYCNESFCCDNVSQKRNESACATQEDPKEKEGWDSSIKMLGVIIGGMVASFTGAMIAHTLLRKLAKKLLKRRNPSLNQATSEVSSTGACNSLPLYEDLYETKCNPTDAGRIRVTQSEEDSEDRQHSFDGGGRCADEPPPPSYSTLFMRSEEDTRHCDTIPTISSRL